MGIRYITSRPRLLRNVIVSTLAILSATVLLTIVLYGFEKNALLCSENERLVLAAQSAATHIDPDIHAEIADPGDRFSDAYELTSNILGEILRGNEYIRNIYTVRMTEGSPTYVVDVPSDLNRDGVLDKNERAQGIGDTAEFAPSDALRSALTGSVAASDELHKDGGGTWLTACAPLKRYDGSIDGAVCTQSEVSLLRHRMLVTAYITFGTMALLSIALIILAASLLILRERLSEGEQEATKADAMMDVFRAAFEHSSLTAVQSLSRNGEIVLWSRACEEIFGYGRAEAEGNNALDLLFDAEGRAQFDKMLDRIWETKLAQPAVELKLLRSDKSRATILFQLMPILHGGEVTEALLIAIDVSSRQEAMKKTEDKVKELKNLQERLLAREGRMIELKNEINSLLERLGEKPKYVT